MADLGPGMGHLFPVCRNEIPGFCLCTASGKQHEPHKRMLQVYYQLY